MARQRGPSARMPTVRQLCAQLGTTPATLDGVLAELEARRILWRRQGSGIYVSPDLGRQSVALLFNPAYLRGQGASPFWGLLVDAVQAEAHARDMEVSFHFAVPPDQIALTVTPQDAPTTPIYAGLEAEIRDGRVHGLLTVGVQVRDIGWLEARGIPTVSFAGAGPFEVRDERTSIFRMLIGALKDIGCRRIGYWMALPPFVTLNSKDPSQVVSNASRFRVALEEAGLPFDAALVQDNRALLAGGAGGVVTTGVQEQAFETARSVFSAAAAVKPPDGVVFIDDMVTLGALTGLRTLGVDVGTVVQVATTANVGSTVLAGYDDRIIQALLDPKILAAAMLDLLDRRITKIEDAPARVVNLRHTLIVPEILFTKH
jgi:DNA-binding LacI/PurR family transcriptional regulator